MRAERYAGKSQVIEDVEPTHVLDAKLEAGYQAMAADVEREHDASVWINGLARPVR